MAILFTDSGAGADANPAGGAYTTFTGFSAIRREGNHLRGSVDSANNGAYVNSVADKADSWMQGTVEDSNTASIGLMLRCATGAANGYLVQLFSGNGHLVRWDAGGYNMLTSASVSITANDVVYFEIVGATLTAKVNGSTVLTTTDATYATGRFGLYAFSDASGLSDITAGDFGSGDVKTVGGLAVANVKTYNGIAAASIKTINGVPF